MCVSPRLLSGRLASLAALISSGVLTSGSDSLTRLFARATSRLWRFAILLSILLHYTLAAVLQVQAGVVDSDRTVRYSLGWAIRLDGSFVFSSCAP